MLFVGILLIGHLSGKDYALEETAGDTRDEGGWWELRVAMGDVT